MRLKLILKALALTVAGFLLVTLLGMLGLRILLERAPHYQAQIKSWLKHETGYPMEFASVRPSFHWSGPELYLDRLELRSKDGTHVLARAASGRVGIDPWQMVHRGRLLALRVELDEPAISIERVGPHTFAIGSDVLLGGEPSGTLRLEDWPDGTLSIRRGRILITGWNEALPRLALERVDLDLRHGSRLLVRASAQLPQGLGGTLRMSGSARGEAAAALLWQVSLNASDVSFAGWRKLLPEYLTRLNGGTGAFDLGLGGRGPVLAHADLRFAARHVTMQLADEPESAFEVVSGQLMLDHAGDRWMMHGRHLKAAVPGRSDPESEFDASIRGGESGLLELEAQANHLRAEALLPLAGLMPQRELRARLRDIAPSGEWSDMRIALSRATTADPWKLNCRARFSQVGFAPVGRAPGLRGLSGELAGDEQGGHVLIDARQAVFYWPHQLIEPLALERLTTTLYWRRSSQEFLVATPAVSFQTHGAGVRAQVAWSSPRDDSSPTLTLAGSIQGGDASEARFFFPRQLLPPNALAWLDHAFVKGHLGHADLVFSGPVRNFPFRDGSGLFLVRAALGGMTLDYRDHWPLIEDGEALAEFRNQGMDVKIQSARAGGLKVDSGEARFPDFKNGELTIEALAHGDAGDALAFLGASPLDAMAEHGFSSTEAHGPLQFGLHLFLPFKEIDQRRVLVHLDLKGDSAARVGSSVAASEVSGEVDIDGAQVARADLHGRLLGGPFTMTAHAPRNRPVVRTVLEFRGTLSGEGLRAGLGLPASVKLAGEADWRASLRMSPEPARERSLHAVSNLAGLALGLPAPLDKEAGQLLPASLEAQWPSSGALELKLTLDGVAQSAAVLDSDTSGGWKLARAALALGGTDPPLFSDTQVVNVTGRLERLDLAGWLRLAAMPKGAKPAGSYLSSAAVQVQSLDYLGLTFRDLSLNIAALEGGWRIGVSGPNAAGTVIVPGSKDPAAPLSIQFERLRVFDPVTPAGADDSNGAAVHTSVEAKAEGGASAVDPRSIPAVNLHIADLRWAERSFGDVHATLTHVDDGIALKLLTLAAPTFSASATGDWRVREASVARIAGKVRSTDVAATLKQLGFDPVIEAKDGSIEFDLRWLGLPSAEALAAATGQLKIALDNGQIVHLKPGAGRVVGLASLTELPRRLAFDFSDLTDKGFAFDTMRGNFQLRDGSAYTDDVLVRGPAAEIGLIGRVGLKNKDFDQTAVVTGNVASSPLPLAAFAGGPVVGAAVVLFTQVFKQPLKGLVRGYYRITGSWENPTVERLKGADAAAAATAEAPK
ncbi:MAG TPA: YhdP family protein [Steroidobacteraceae bacterium]|nr:YhdP family protein [Steroidobacteraceae bacterium]